jgi:DNA-binding LacI/PurR family transcriptional regulator
VVSFGRTDLSEFHSWVDVDGRAGTRAAVEHLIGQGHQRLALVAWPAGSITGDERAAGFREGLKEAGLGIDPRYVVRVENEVESGREAAARLLDLEPAPTAIVTVQDVLAAGVAAEFNARGIRGGRDVAVTGFDDSPPAIYSTPSITSVRQPIEAIGRRVVEFLMHDLEDSDDVPLSALVEPELVIRESSTGWDPV